MRHSFPTMWLILHQITVNQPLVNYKPWTLVASSWIVIALFLAIYFPMNSRNAADYVTVFNADVETISAIEAAAAAEYPTRTQLIVATYPDYLRTWELYDVAYMHYDSKKSAFLRDWSVIPFLTRFANLRPIAAVENPLVQDHLLLEQCVSLCQADGQQQPWQLLPMSDEQTLCLCP
ncbi:MAG: hypothetical protein R2932_56200 [Caldilineaceae bacterium]